MTNSNPDDPATRRDLQVLALVGLMLLSTSVVARPRTSTEPLQVQILNNCIAEQVLRIDDGRSDARTIALVVLDTLCRSQLTAMARADLATLPPSPSINWNAPDVIDGLVNTYIHGFLPKTIVRVLVLRKQKP